MKLYITHHSPYARMARIMLREKNLQAAVKEITAQTRRPGSPYYSINPSGRVPYLLRAEGIGMEGSQLICDYLDQLDGEPAFERPVGADLWEVLRLEEQASSLMDCVSVWIRELLRPPSDRSETIIDHENARCQRLVRTWEDEIDSQFLNGSFNYAQMKLACALQLNLWNPYFTWRSESPALVAWLDCVALRPALKDTEPPSPIAID